MRLQKTPKDLLGSKLTPVCRYWPGIRFRFPCQSGAEQLYANSGHGPSAGAVWASEMLLNDAFLQEVLPWVTGRAEARACFQKGLQRPGPGVVRELPLAPSLFLF